MKIYAVVQHLDEGWIETSYDKFFTTKDKAELRKNSLERKNKSKYIDFSIEEIEVGE